MKVVALRVLFSFKYFESSHSSNTNERLRVVIERPLMAKYLMKVICCMIHMHSKVSMQYMILNVLHILNLETNFISCPNNSNKFEGL